MSEDSARDFFISYTAADEPWAKWIAVTLDAAGYTTVLQAWDFRPGSDFVHQMQDATSRAARTVAVLSPAHRLGRELGRTTLTGAEVIAVQAAEQFVLYTGVRPTPDQVRRASEFSRA
jgi:hypothetical protein